MKIDNSVPLNCVSDLKLIKNIQSIAKEVLQQEAEAVRNLIELIDDEFENCVYAILNSGGRVVISGVGKSAIVGQKIVATLNSTGTPALFMHAADAIHGDLGMIQDNDVVIVISKSGDTAEIKVLVPLLKRTGVTMIAMVSNKRFVPRKKQQFYSSRICPFGSRSIESGAYNQYFCDNGAWRCTGGLPAGSPRVYAR
jgi:fructoselysine-6-P-deglycase FrlB-like protein